jgi:hypothetical protein
MPNKDSDGQGKRAQASSEDSVEIRAQSRTGKVPSMHRATEKLLGSSN